MIPRNTALPAESIDVERIHQLDRIKILEEALTHLNILEHPLQIHEICSNIIDIKKSLETLPAPGGKIKMD